MAIFHYNKTAPNTQKITNPPDNYYDVHDPSHNYDHFIQYFQHYTSPTLSNFGSSIIFEKKIDLSYLNMFYLCEISLLSHVPESICHGLVVFYVLFIMLTTIIFIDCYCFTTTKRTNH